MITGPSINKGRSRQDFETPWEFIHAVEKRFGPLKIDLAASPENTKAPAYITANENSLDIAWGSINGNCWCNPPFGNISPWAAKCATPQREYADATKFLLLTPASVGANWFTKYVFNRALVLFLSPRICFDGKNPFPKDCILSVYGATPGFECWRWK